MAKVSLKAGTTSYIARVMIYDSSSTTGAGLSGLTSSSVASWKVYTARDDDGNAAATGVALSAGTRGTWSSGGFVEKDATNQKGVYELGIPNAALAAGSKSCLCYLSGATNMVPLVLEIELTAVDNQDGVRYGLTALPNFASGSAGAIPTTGTGSNQISVSSGQVILQSGTGTGQLNFTSGVVQADAAKINGVSTSSVTTINANQGTTQPLNFTGTAGSALVKGDVVDIAGAAVSTSTAQIGVNAVNWGGGAIPAPNVTGVPLVDLKYTLGTISPATAGSVRADAVTGAVGSVTGAVGSVTGNVGGNVVGSVGSVTGSVGSVTGAVGSVTGAVGSVTGNVGGNVVGSVASVTGAVGSVTGNVGGNVVGSVASVTAVVSANLTKINGTTVNGNGAGTPWGP